MKKLSAVIVIIILVTASFSGCYYDKADQLYPPRQVKCDTTNVRHSVEITNILKTYCADCHGGNATAGGGNRLIDDFATLKSKATGGQLLFRITLPINDAGRMPRGRPPLDSCNIAQIRTWIREGSKQN
jgi:mono/diheme cytochrome c family protein